MNRSSLVSSSTSFRDDTDIASKRTESFLTSQSLEDIKKKLDEEHNAVKSRLEIGAQSRQELQVECVSFSSI